MESIDVFSRESFDPKDYINELCDSKPEDVAIDRCAFCVIHTACCHDIIDFHISVLFLRYTINHILGI